GAERGGLVSGRQRQQWVVTFVVVSFFFSSRRRHTSWPRDWSSDVCSSDLREIAAVAAAALVLGADRAAGRHDQVAADVEAHRQRSEERRVGKECRSRWLLDA